eukprot:TRINITY_DN15197_c1_g2_i1.p1 TRINITY_DN15197_c1_g2~~TRINITY_DN15197_c1_g2_i1.p1  ORF type:complete len:265 (+),score=41.03 TRINITY_DN15197_c1_g2_i1:46-795(+)
MYPIPYTAYHPYGMVMPYSSYYWPYYYSAPVMGCVMPSEESSDDAVSVEKLPHTEMGKGNKIVGLLNKISANRYDALREEVVGLYRESAVSASELTQLIVKQSNIDILRVSLYARLCKDLCEEGNSLCDFRKQLLGTCQQEYERLIENLTSDPTATVTLGDKNSMRFLHQLHHYQVLGVRTFTCIVTSLHTLSVSLVSDGLASPQPLLLLLSLPPQYLNPTKLAHLLPELSPRFFSLLAKGLDTQKKIK